jgi:hypothetical protein
MKALLASVALLGALSGCGTASSESDGMGGERSSGGRTGSSGGQTGNSGGSGEGGSGGRAVGGGSAGAASDNCGEPGVCDLVECAPEDKGGSHVAPCSEISPSTNPPTSGPHYQAWAQFGVYDQPIPDGFFIHSLEHSSVALLYDCEAADEAGLDCDELRQELVDFYDAWPEDVLCTDIPHRLIVAPRPGLGAPFAAAAWGHYLKGDCFDVDRVGEFVRAHYANNYENICNSGVNPFEQGCSVN